MPQHRHFAPPRPGKEYEQTDPYSSFKLEVAVTVLNELHGQIQAIIKRSEDGEELTEDDLWDAVIRLYDDVFDESILAIDRLDPACSPQCRLLYGTEWTHSPEVERDHWLHAQAKAGNEKKRA